MSLLCVDDLYVDLPGGVGPVRVLDGVSFDLPAGGALGLVGESGCGKSMTALAVMGLLPEGAKANGRIRLNGHDLLGLPDATLCTIRGRRMAMVFQEPMTALNPVQTIGRQVAEAPRRHLGLSRAAAEERARHLLDRVGLPTMRFPPDLYPHQLSGGQRQRVGIAIALSCDPVLLIADEPTTALDVTIQAQILDLITELSLETGMALLLISHDLGVIAQTTDRMAVMYAGRIAETGPTAAVFGHMAHPYTRALFAAMPQAAETGARLSAIPGQVPAPGRTVPGCHFADRCRHAGQRCRDAPPPALTAVDPDHVVACHFPQARDTVP